uniref:Uncharacterized protein n=1 Tax=Anguilla anguilla TaxID=7936 RepID=A0A0E9VD17_ANGAN
MAGQQRLALIIPLNRPQIRWEIYSVGGEGFSLLSVSVLNGMETVAY